jgi:hypothetical protein
MWHASIDKYDCGSFRHCFETAKPSMVLIQRLAVLTLCCFSLCGVADAVRVNRATSVSEREGALVAAAAPPLLKKRGVAWGLNATHIHQLAGLEWWYNWGPSVNDVGAVAAAAEVGMHFVPEQVRNQLAY